MCNRHGYNATFRSIGEPPVAVRCEIRLTRTKTLLYSTKIHEEDYRREIQTNVGILAPEIMSVFAHSQIFHDSNPSKSPAQQPATFSIGSKVDKAKLSQITEDDEAALMQRLDEGNEY